MKLRLAASMVAGVLLCGMTLPHVALASHGGSSNPTPTPVATTVPGPSAPTLLGPADGASVTEPFTISWSASTGPAPIANYNWEVSTTSTFAAYIANNSTDGQTQDSVSGLPAGTYFWRVDAWDGTSTGPWSTPRSFTITGTNAAAPDAPVLNPIPFGAAFHPLESFPFSWSAVPGAVTYTVDAAPDPTFPRVSEIHNTNITGTSSGLDMGDSLQQGTWYLRVTAVNAAGVSSLPSNVETFVLSYNAPLPPPPTLLTPANGATVALPVTLSWTDVPNPQDSGYTYEVATDPQFNNIEDFYNQQTPPNVTELSLTPGTKYWRVLATQGDSSPDLPAQTAWSATGTFVVGSNPTAATPSVTIASPFSGDTETVSIQLTAPAPAGGSTVTLSSSNPSAVPLPATFTMPAGQAYGAFQVQIGQVTAPTPVTLTESINGTSASVNQTVQPPSLKTLSLFSPIVGGSSTGAVIALNGEAPAGGAVIQLASSDPALVSLPDTVTVAAGSPTLSLSVQTAAATTTTAVTLTATWNGVTAAATITLTPTPPQAPSALTLQPASVTAGSGSTGTVTLTGPVPSDTQIALASGIPAIASVPASVLVPAGANSASFPITTFAIPTTTTVGITATGGGVKKLADLTVVPSASPPLSSLTVNPTSVQGGTSSRGTVTLSAAAPSGGELVTLSSGNTAVATVSSGVTVPAGSTSATFTVSTTAPSSSTSVTISATAGGATQTASLTVGSSPPPPADTVKVTLAEYDGSKHILHVQATSTSAGAVLKTYATSSGALIGTLTNTGGGKYESQFSVSANPGNVTVKSSLGGSATLSVTAK